MGGAISGNVHGRDSHYNYSTFGDNIISLKVMSEDGSIKIITNKKKIFYKIVGGLGVYKIILEAKLKVFQVENY